MSKTRFYRIYCHICNRCNRKKNDNYMRYGGKGVKNEWDSFVDFMNDMYVSYVEKCSEIGEKNVSIERKDNDKNYCKENCEWIHLNKQQSNRRINHYLEYEGKKQTIREWAKELGMSESVIRNRVLYYGMNTERALTEKVGNYFGNPDPMKVIYNGNTYTVKELEKVVPYSKETIYRKIKRGEIVKKEEQIGDFEELIDNNIHVFKRLKDK